MSATAPTPASPSALHDDLRELVEYTTVQIKRCAVRLKQILDEAEESGTPLPAKEVVVIVSCFKRIAEIARIICVLFPPLVVVPEVPLSAHELMIMEGLADEEEE